MATNPLLNPGGTPAPKNKPNTPLGAVTQGQGALGAPVSGPTQPLAGGTGATPTTTPTTAPAPATAVAPTTAPTAAPAAAPAAGSATTSSGQSWVDRLVSQVQGAGGVIDPANDLRNTTFMPGASADQQRSQELMMQGLESLFSAPNRGQIAADTLTLAREQSAPAYEQALRTVGQRAGALGRTNAGMTTNELSDVFLTRERDLDQLGRSLALEAAGLEMSDRLNAVGASSSVNDRLFGQGFSERQEMRGERDYQGQRERDALDDALQRAAAEEGLRSGEWSRNFAQQQEASANARWGQQFAADQRQRDFDNYWSGLFGEDRLAGNAFDREMRGADFTSREAQREFDNEMRRLGFESDEDQRGFENWMKNEAFKHGVSTDEFWQWLQTQNLALDTAR